MDTNIKYDKGLYIDKDVLTDHDNFILRATGILSLIKRSYEYTSYIAFIAKRISDVEELHFDKISEIDIIETILIKQLDNNEFTSVFRVCDEFMRLLFENAFEVYPISNVNHNILHAKLLQDDTLKSADILAELGIIPIGSFDKFIEDYFNYIPKQLMCKLDIKDDKLQKPDRVLNIHMDLNIRVSGHEVDDGGTILFILDLGRTLKSDYEGEFNKLILLEYDPLDDTYEVFKYSKSREAFDIDESMELKAIFGTEDDMYNAITPYTINYLIDNNLPRWYLTNESMIEHVAYIRGRNETNYSYQSGFTKNSIDPNYSFSIDIKDNKVRIFSKIADVTVDDNSQYLNVAIDKYVKEWNKNAKEKFDWTIYDIK